MIKIEKFDQPIKFICNGSLGLIIGRVADLDFFAVDFGDGELKFVPFDAGATLNPNGVQ
jgi:hypothetical protein